MYRILRARPYCQFVGKKRTRMMSQCRLGAGLAANPAPKRHRDPRNKGSMEFRSYAAVSVLLKTTCDQGCSKRSSQFSLDALDTMGSSSGVGPGTPNPKPKTAWSYILRPLSCRTKPQNPEFRPQTIKPNP